jgi:hypothetical protein
VKIHTPFFLAAVGFALLAADEASAQKSEVDCGAATSLTGECLQAFERWEKAELEWREWVKKYGNGYAHNSAGVPVKSRPSRPAPLAWMSAYCSRMPPELPECRAHDEALKYDWVAHQPPPPPLDNYFNKKAVPARAGEGFDFWTWLWRSTHFDVGWTPPDPRQRTVGLVGVHLALAQVGERLYFFGPGVILTRYHGRLKVGTTWGMSYRLTDFRVFGTGPSFDLFVNVANLKLDQGVVEAAGVRQDRGVIGLSFAIRR